MILDKTIKLNIKTNKDLNYLKKVKFNGDFKVGETIDLPLNYLSKGSHKIINVKCDNCGEIKKIQYNTYIRISINDKYYCNNKECINKKRKLSIQKKHGVSNVFQLDDIKEKSKKSLISKYGYDNAQKVPDIKRKTMETCYIKYGHYNPFQSEKIKKKIRNTNMKRYGVEYPQQSSMIRDKYSSLHISSKVETELYCFIKNNLKYPILKNVKNIISGYELDTYVPYLNLAFEFNGLYWHNEISKNKNYHLNKTELCEEQEIQLIHIYEDDWEFKKNIIKSMILNKIGKTPNKIFARKTKVKEIIDNKIIRDFLINNHRQGFVGSSIKLGLFYNENLVSLMTFGKRRVVMGKKKSNNEEYELLRFCNKLNTNIVGGANKLFKHFIKNHNPKEITTYADRSWGNGNLYKQLGFKYHGKTQPNYYYIINRKRKYRFGFRKDKLVKEGFDINKSERQIMLDRKIYRIYDSGNLKFIY